MNSYTNAPKSWCHGCGLEASIHKETLTPDGSRMPDPGDLSICSRCGEINVFNDILVLEKPDDLDALLSELSPEDRQALHARVAQIRSA